MRNIRPFKPSDAVKVDVAIAYLQNARRLFCEADCPQALEKVRAAIRSAEGARRHVQHRENRANAKLEA